MGEVLAYRPSEAQLPCDVEAEQAVLGSLLIDTRAILRLATFLRAEDFYLPVNAEIYRSMLALHESKVPTDVVTVTDHLRSNSRLDDTGGMAYLSSLSMLVPTSMNAVHYGRIVERLSVLRQIIDAGNRITGIGQDERYDSEKAVADSEATLEQIRLRLNARTHTELNRHEFLDELLTDLLSDYDPDKHGLKTGLQDLDAKLGGLKRSELTTVGARPSVGKTALATTICHYIARRSCKKVILLSAEMPRRAIYNRLLAIETGLPYKTVTSYRMSPTDRSTLADGAEALKAAHLEIVEARDMAVSDIRARVHELATAMDGVDLIAIDYLQILSETKGKWETNALEIGRRTKGIHDMAQDHDCPVLLLSQLNRDCEDRADQQPMLSDLFQSSSIEHDSDAVLMLYPDVENPGNDRMMSRYCKVAKNRNGETGTVRLGFQPDLMHFVSLGGLGF